MLHENIENFLAKISNSLFYFRKYKKECRIHKLKMH